MAETMELFVEGQQVMSREERRQLDQQFYAAALRTRTRDVVCSEIGDARAAAAVRALWRENSSHLSWLTIVDANDCDYAHCRILYESTHVRTYVPVLDRAWPGYSVDNDSQQAMLEWWASHYFSGQVLPTVYCGVRKRAETPWRFTLAGREWATFSGCAPRIETRPYVEDGDWGGSYPGFPSAWRKREFGNAEGRW